MTELPICAEEMMRGYLSRVCEAVTGAAEEEAV